MSTPTKQAPAKAPAKSVESPATAAKVDFSKLQVVEGGTISRAGTPGVDRLKGTPVIAQLQNSYNQKDDAGHGKVFTVGPVEAADVQAVKNLYNLGATQLRIGVAYGYDAAKKGLAIRAQDRKKHDAEMRTATAKARRDAKAVNATPEQIDAAVKAAKDRVLASRSGR